MVADAIGGANARNGPAYAGSPTAVALSGALTVASPRGHGTTLAAELPLSEIDGHERTA